MVPSLCHNSPIVNEREENMNQLNIAVAAAIKSAGIPFNIYDAEFFEGEGKLFVNADVATNGELRAAVMAEDGSPHTAHTLGQVRCILVDDERRSTKLRDGSLCDIAPTILEIMGLEQPGEMTGRSLIK